MIVENGWDTDEEYCKIKELKENYVIYISTRGIWNDNICFQNFLVPLDDLDKAP